jgi:pilus assembly protein CpaB
MKKNNLLKLLGIALVVAIVSTGIFYGLFVNRLSSSTGSGKTLVVAAKILKAGTEIQAGDVKTVPWPATDLPKGAFENVDQVVGKAVFDTIAEDEPVMSQRLATENSGSGIPAGMRAISVHVTDSTGVLALVRNGQKVDVQVVVTHKEQNNAVEVRTALEDLSVLSVHPQADLSSQGTSLPVVTLLAKPADADVLAAADSGARVRITLRNPLDDATRSRAPVTLDTIMRTSGTSGTTQKDSAGEATARVVAKP